MLTRSLLLLGLLTLAGCASTSAETRSVELFTLPAAAYQPVESPATPQAEPAVEEVPAGALAELGKPVQIDVDLSPVAESAPDPVHDVTAKSAYYTILYFRDGSPETRAADAGAAKLVAAHWPVVAIDVNKWPEFARQHCVVKGPMFVCLQGGIEIGRATTGDDPGAMVRQIYGLDAPRATVSPQASPTPAACPNGQCPNGQCPAPQQWWGRRR